MKASEVMNRNTVCCTPDTPITTVAKMMIETDGGAIPVVDNGDPDNPVIGMITDRDIVCRTIGQERNPMTLQVKDAMSRPAVAAGPDDNLEFCLDLMKTQKVRRLPVVDDRGRCLGLVTQAHMATHLSPETVGRYLGEISPHSERPSDVRIRPS